ncbi:DUF3907 family protein [Bacillus nakamurai]|uniref:DUF3907 family protein n=1 Tax=Bacillus nakamurai TaxID=1793963 RepID=UPI0020C25799|nr:DUF3907 family protein [Bacillus nakamurai]MCP6681214.1 YpuI family protein [Bacillus nakamurai]
MNDARYEVQERKETDRMGNSIVRAHTEETGEFLAKVVTMVSSYLNHTTLPDMQASGGADEAYCRDVLSVLRRMTVFCEGAQEACRRLLIQEPFQEASAEKMLFKVYHQCVEEFFMPKKDTWYENSRAAYTDQSTIQFYQHVPDSLQSLLLALSRDFLHMREELAQYEASGSNIASVR